jgi:hypothetical protein
MQFADNTCGICGGTTPTEGGKRRVWYYEPRADFYCARHWEDALADDSRSNTGNDYWHAVVRPVLEVTRRKLERQARVAATR